jgi:hypothetical protein
MLNSLNIKHSLRPIHVFHQVSRCQSACLVMREKFWRTGRAVAS